MITLSWFAVTWAGANRWIAMSFHCCILHWILTNIGISYSYPIVYLWNGVRSNEKHFTPIWHYKFCINIFFRRIIFQSWKTSFSHVKLQRVSKNTSLKFGVSHFGFLTLGDKEANARSFLYSNYLCLIKYFISI